MFFAFFLHCSLPCCIFILHSAWGVVRFQFFLSLFCCLLFAAYIPFVVPPTSICLCIFVACGSSNRTLTHLSVVVCWLHIHRHEYIRIFIWTHTQPHANSIALVFVYLLYLTFFPQLFFFLQAAAQVQRGWLRSACLLRPAFVAFLIFLFYFRFYDSQLNLIATRHGSHCCSPLIFILCRRNPHLFCLSVGHHKYKYIHICWIFPYASRFGKYRKMFIDFLCCFCFATLLLALFHFIHSNKRF